ncbi:polysaccharide biosynthesis tyrosine autokinase [Nocardioides jiangxiensis]|uniref:non-specific protein-tyrosine kinase n=1 Tax=Nocardioides jiangxiensis TaxID=3064524 RepID=A0ABT9AZ29_9ACTN|nr:polysaccharide biosynthesis tyrosine autokinase [Nocardioides sp. WY-20]MDO7867845.1 polysaccharide biosynthesis tyrosine autokinase [Nocardioides sp. WY-20]
MDFKELLRTLRRRWKTIAAITLVAVIGSLTLSLRATEIYQSTAQVFITTDSSNVQETALGNTYTQQRMDTYAQLATHRVLLAQVIDQLNLELSPTDLAGRIHAEVQPNTTILRITVSDTDPKNAQKIAQVEADQLVEFLRKLETPSTSEVSQIQPTVTDPATFNPVKVSPQTSLNLVVALLIGLTTGIAVAIARELLDQTVKSATDVEKAADVPLMAAIGYDPSVEKSPLVLDISSFSPRAEAFRLLRTNLQFLDLDHPPRAIVITSSVSGEGKTTSSTNLALALAQAGRRVLLVDGDLRRPRVAQLMGMDGSIGLTTVLVGRTKLEDSIQRHKESGVHVLASGPTPPNPSEILQANATHDLLGRLRDAYDIVIIDAPPLLPVADAALLATAADGAIIVTRHGKTTRDQLEGAAHRLAAVGARTFGVVLNMAPKRFGEMNYYYYYAEEAEPSAKGSGKRSSGSRRA